MAGRGMSSAMLAELERNSVQPVHLIELAFDSVTRRVTDAYKPLVFAGETYDALGGFLSLEGVTETSELLINRVRATLSGVDPASLMRLVQQDDFLDRPARMYLGFLNADGDLIAEPFIKFSGRMDSPSIAENSEDGTSVVTVEAVPDLADYGRRPGRHGNNAEQQFYYPGDLGFDFVSQVPKQLKWGRA